MATPPRYDTGLAMLAEVLGEDYARRVRAGADDPVQAPFTIEAVGSVWGGAWARETFDRRTRSLLTLALLVALKQPEEIALHVGGALANGATPAEIRGVVLHAMPYCGVPAALEAWRAVLRTLKARDAAAADG